MTTYLLNWPVFSRAGVPRLPVSVPRQVCGYLTVGDPEGSGHMDVPDVPANELTSLPATCGHAARTRSRGPCTACDRFGLSSITHTHTRPFIFSKPKMGWGDFVPREKKSGSEQLRIVDNKGPNRQQKSDRQWFTNQRAMKPSKLSL